MYMKKNDYLNRWYKRPVTPYLFFVAIILFSFSALFRAEFGGEIPSAEKGFSVITQHYGINSEEIERTITIPLEESISVIAGIDQLRSSSEYAKSRIDIKLRKDTDSTEFYLDLRDRIERIYSTLPQSVQKPQIVTSSSSQRPSFIISFASDISDSIQLRPFVENEIKSSFEQIPGIGEIEIGGGALKEIHVALNEEKLTLAGQNPGNIASVIQSQNLYSPLGKIKLPLLNIPVSIDGRLNDINQIKELKILSQSGTYIELQELANVKYGFRKPESISRVQGQEKVILYIKTGGDANIITLSEIIQQTVKYWKNKGLTIDTIYDQGKEMKSAVNQVLATIVIGMIVVAFFVTFAVRNLRQVIILSVSLPLTGLTSISILSFFKIPIDNYILAGMAIAIGIIIDTGIVITEFLKIKKNKIEHILGALISSILTSVIVLFPLIYLRNTIAGIGPISLALLVMLLSSLVLNIFFIPVFFKGNQVSNYKSGFLKKIKQLLLRVSNTSYKFGSLVVILTFGLVFMAILALFFSGRKLDSILEEPVIFAHIEMESGASVSSVDQRIKEFTILLKNNPAILQIETIAKRGNAQLTIRYNEKTVDPDKLKNWIKEKSSQIPRGALFIQEESTSKTIKVEISITGADNNELRKLAKETLNDFMKEPWVEEGVLHFKDPPPSYVLKIDHSQFPITRLSARNIVDRFRWNLQGPVADKWIENGNEMDLRIMGEGNKEKTYNDLLKLPFTNASSQNSIIRADQLGTFIKDTEPSRIYRKNKQRCIYFSIKVKSINLDTLENKIWSVLEKENLPNGYAFELDKKIYRQKEQLNKLGFLFLLAIFLIYAVLATQSESFKAPLIILLFIPVSLAFPVIALWIIKQSLSTSIIIGFIVLTGMVVNNAILLIDYCHDNSEISIELLIFQAIRYRLKPLLLTSGTTILGTFPMMFNNPGNFNFLNSLSFIMIFGILGSLFASLVFLPALAKMWPSGFKPSQSKLLS